jgi:hypothetical protein
VKRALSSPSAFSLRVIFLLTLPSTITLPLTERFESGGQLLLYMFVSLMALIAVVVIAIPMRTFAKTSLYRWWFTPILGFVLGATRGVLSWFLNDELELAQQSLLVRTLTSGSIWLVLLPLFAYFNHVFMRSRRQNQNLRSDLARAKTEYDSLEQQRSWLYQARVEGLDSELAAQFVGLTKKLNEQGLGPDAYRDIAGELRELAREQVRPKSIQIYRPKLEFKPLFQEFLKTVPNPALVALSYVASSGLNNIRVEGLGISFLAQVISAIMILLTLLAARRFSFLSQFVWLSASAPTFITLSLSEAQGSLVISQTLSAAIWSQSLALSFGLLELTLSRQRATRQKLEQTLNATQLDIQSLTVDLETKNIDIAKYLHAILQTRLMSYAMQLEKGEVSESQLKELTELLTHPMREFDTADRGLMEELEILKVQWQPLVEIEILPFSNTLSDLDASSIQVIREAIANSVRHGLAEKIDIAIKDSTNREITISDSGIGPRVGPDGLGTEVFNQLCSHWELTRNNLGGAKFHATINKNRENLADR